MIIRSAILSVLMAGAVSADTPALVPGAPLTPAQIGHAFIGGCLATQPEFIRDTAEIFETAFSFVRSEDDTQVAYQNSTGDIGVSVRGNPIDATCEMHLPVARGGEGGDAYDLFVSMQSHLLEQAPDARQDMDDGVLIHYWDKDGVNFRTEWQQIEDTLWMRVLITRQ